MSRNTLRNPLLRHLTTVDRPPKWICLRCLTTESRPKRTTPRHARSLPLSQSDSIPTKIVSDPFPKRLTYDPSLPAKQRDYRLNKVDFNLKKPLSHALPPQYLQHSTSPLLHPREHAQREKVQSWHKEIVGVVVSAGKMEKTVKVRVPGQKWNSRIGKYFRDYAQHLVHDPNSSLVPGDVVQLHRLRISATVNHVVAAIVSPFGKPLDERPPIPSPDERLAKYKEKRFAKLQRRADRRTAAEAEKTTERRKKAAKLIAKESAKEYQDKKATATVKVEKKGKGAKVGSKGQELPDGVLPGGKHEVGKISERARRNKQQAMKSQQTAEANAMEAKERAEAVLEEKEEYVPKSVEDLERRAGQSTVEAAKRDVRPGGNVGTKIAEKDESANTDAEEATGQQQQGGSWSDRLKGVFKW